MRPVFIFSATPHQSLTISDFFGRADLRKILEAPHELRPDGWDLHTTDTMRVGDGPCLELGTLEYKLVRLFEDGTLLARVFGDEHFLAWASSGPRIQLNPIALIEFVYNFVSTWKQVLELSEEQPKAVRFLVTITGAKDNNDAARTLVLPPYGANSGVFTRGVGAREAPMDSMQPELDVPADVVVGRPGRAAYLLAERIYLAFGHTTDVVPYVTLDGVDRAIDPNLLFTKK